MTSDLGNISKEKDISFVEKQDVESEGDPALHAEFDPHDLDKVQRRLSQRHVQMIAIAGTIGTGLFLGSGEALAVAGPLGALIAYGLVSTVTYASLCALGEMTTWAPISGSFPHYSERWVDPALGFALGWNYFYGMAVSIPVEVTAAVILISYWDDRHDHVAMYTAIISILVCLINIVGVRYFGESEFFFSIIKICLITGLILAGLVIDLGGGPDRDRIGFRYWNDPGPLNRRGLVSNLNTDRFLSFVSVLIQAAFSFQGMELVAISAAETKNPRRNVAKAVRRVFWRIMIFYILGILMIGMLVPYNDELLLRGAGTAAASPFVIAMERAGIKVLPHIVNGAVFTSAFSAGNSYLYCASRILYGLALRRQAPKIFTYCTKNGLPIVAVLTSGAFTFLSFMSVSSGSSKAFNWLVSLSTTGGFTGWFAMNLTYIFFYRGLKAQGLDRKKNTYHGPFQPYLSWWGAIWTVIFIFINGYAVFWDFNASDFIVAYINIPIFVGLYIFWKVYKKTKIWKPSEMDFVTGIPSPEETETPEAPAKNMGQRIFRWLF